MSKDNDFIGENLKQAALTMAKSLHDAEVNEVNALAELEAARHELMLIEARIEQQVISDAGGEQKVGATGDTRMKAFFLEKVDNPDYQKALRKRNEAKRQYAYSEATSSLKQNLLVIRIEGMRMFSSNQSRC